MNFKLAHFALLGFAWLSGMVVAVPATASVNIFACEPEWQSLAEALGGDKVKADSATTAFQDPHHIEARPSLIVKARRADLLFCTGAELETGWLPILLERSTNARIQKGKPGYFMAAAQVELIEKPAQVDRSQGDVHADGNPHVHWDPYRLLTIAKAFSGRLQALDSPNSPYYRQRLSTFSSEWQDAISDWEARTASLQGKQAIVYHKNWSYLLNWLGVEIIGDLEPKPGIPPTSAHLTDLLGSARSADPFAILITNYQDEKGANWLSGKAGVPVVSLPFTVGGSEQANSLFALYDQVLARLLQVP